MTRNQKKAREKRKKAQERWKKVREGWENFSKKVKAFLVKIKAQEKLKNAQEKWEKALDRWHNFAEKRKAFVIAVALVLAVIFLTDEYGTPWFMWNWTYGLIDGRYRAIACEGFDEEMIGRGVWAENFMISTRVVGLRGGGTTGRLHDGDEIIINRRRVSLDGNQITINPRRVSLHGFAIFWQYLQVSVNGELVRHRWPRADAIYAGKLGFELGHQEFQTEGFALQRGRNEIVITAINRGYCVSKTFYIIRE